MVKPHLTNGCMSVIPCAGSRFLRFATASVFIPIVLGTTAQVRLRRGRVGIIRHSAGVNQFDWLSQATLRMSGGGKEGEVPADPEADDGKVRRKMAVGEGRSMLHWQRLKVPISRMNKVTMEEVAKHSSENDSWTVFHGKVYNTTAFYDYHPGGRPYMKMVAGKDGTALFNKYHAYVNIDFMMGKCLIGPLAEAGDATPSMLPEADDDDDDDDFDLEAKKNAQANAGIAKRGSMEEMD